MQRAAYDIIVVGGGHAGCEAALSSARMGLKTLLVTFKIDKIAFMSCNPAIGGIGKGQLVREVDALGGEMGKAIDKTMIQFRMLNTSKGYAARSSRAQADMDLYSAYMRDTILSEKNLKVLEDEVTAIITDKAKVIGVETKKKGSIKSKAVIMTPGTFPDGVIHIGLEHHGGGRIGEPAARLISKNLKNMGFKMLRLKTGTPPRLDGRTIDFSGLDRHDGDKEIIPFSFWTKRIKIKQKPCFITRTAKKTHEIIKNGLDKSPLYTGKIKSTGVRYCPSVEDKIVKFPERETHLVFLEPEGRGTNEYYPNGISTSLPRDIQERIVRSIKGLEKAKVTQWGYGIEYDIVEPTELKSTLETKRIEGLYLAGQINGTTGYEEAACLGLMAGINASKKIKKETPVILNRSQAYIGVLIDDLVTKGTAEPYRMFTSRVEYRMIVREDNAALRLSEIGFSLGLLNKKKIMAVRKSESKIKELTKRIEKDRKLSNLLKRPGISIENIMNLAGWKDNLSYQEKTGAEVAIKYEGYIKRELSFVNKFDKLEKIRISEDFNYKDVPGLSREIKEKLSSLRPGSLGQASRISGVTPVAITLLMVRLHTQGERSR